VKPSPIARAAVLRRFDALFRAMSQDFLLREQFVTDPAQIASEYVYGPASRRAGGGSSISSCTRSPPTLI